MEGLSAGQTLETALKSSRLLRPSRWPLEQALAKAAGASGVFLHLPAHRRGAGRPPSAVALPWPYDLPELPVPPAAEAAISEAYRDAITIEEAADIETTVMGISDIRKAAGTSTAQIA